MLKVSLENSIRKISWKSVENWMRNQWRSWSPGEHEYEYRWFWCGKQNDRPYVTLAMPFNLILSIYPVFLMAMPVNMILVMYVILCILSYDFNKLTMLYIHVHISISMTNKSGLTFLLSIKYLSVCIAWIYKHRYCYCKPRKTSIYLKQIWLCHIPLFTLRSKEHSSKHKTFV